MLSALRRSTATLPRTASVLTSLSTRSTIARSAISSGNNSISKSIQRPSSLCAVSVRAFHQTCAVREQAAVAESEASLPSEDGPVTTFKELGSRKMVHPNVVRSLQRMGLETMTEVQTATISAALRGDDMIAQAKTGTGKTLGFLIPVLQNMISQDPELAEKSFRSRKPRTTADDIRAIIISPTRELAEQIAEEARRLTQGTSVVVQTAVGGTQKNMALRAMQRDGSHILVGTPGRIKDIFSDRNSGVSAPGLDALVFDEADRLLDQGFWPEIQEIIELLPKPEEKDRQTLMFSATVPREVVKLVQTALKPGFQYVRTVRDDEEPTHARVPQKVVSVRGLENYAPTLVEIIQTEIEKSKAPGARPFKAIVYFNSTAEVTCFTSLLLNLPSAESLTEPSANPDNSPNRVTSSFRARGPFGRTRFYEIHAKLAQGSRTRAAENFRKCESGVLLSSDVTARGMDFPNVTHVIQIGLPGNKDTYVHRIGRTARAGKEGEGYLIASELESREIRFRLKDLPLKPVEEGVLKTSSIDMTRESQVPASAATILRQVAEATKLVDREEKEKVYMAYLGIYSWYPNKRDLIEAMNNLSRFGFGFAEPPKIPAGIVSRLRLGRIPGINVGGRGPALGEDDERDPFGGRRDGGSGRSFGGDRGDRGGRGGYGDDRGSRGGYGGSGRSFGGDRGGRREGGFERRGGFGGEDRRGGRDGGFERRSRY